MANIKYFSECDGEVVELLHVWLHGHNTRPISFLGTCPTCGYLHNALRKIEYKAFPSRHECNGKCMGGKVNGVCECKCGGKNHGVGSLPGRPMSEVLRVAA
jgi:hypothetical protein